MAERLAVDYSFARPNLAMLHAAGYEGVLRYLSHTPAKNLTTKEVKAIHATGMWIAVVWETTANRALAGQAAGAADATEAEKQADALGYPKGAVIFYAVDTDATPASVAAYFVGVRAAARRPVGIYGSKRIVDAHPNLYRWQTAAWSHGNLSQTANLYQRTRITTGVDPKGIDENVVLNDFPRWTNSTPTQRHPFVAKALLSNQTHTRDLERIKHGGAGITVRVALAALALERRRLTRLLNS